MRPLTPDDDLFRLFEELVRLDETGGTVRLSLNARNKHSGEVIQTPDRITPVFALELLLPELEEVIEKAHRYDTLLEALQDFSAAAMRGVEDAEEDD